MLSRCEGSFHEAQEKKMMDWFNTKRKWNAHKPQKKTRTIKGRRKHKMERKEM